ncbi:MAG: gamma-glutamylcyclotransferase family protein [Microbacteriaceae bacterium]
MSTQRFAAYGTLGPGKPNHHHVVNIPGVWSHGRVRGTLAEAGWGAALGFPGITLDTSDNWVEVDLLESDALDAHWARLDAFEGPGYRRVPCEVVTDDGVVTAQIYEIVTE